jgi:hypothetical protein
MVFVYRTLFADISASSNIRFWTSYNKLQVCVKGDKQKMADRIGFIYIDCQNPFVIYPFLADLRSLMDLIVFYGVSQQPLRRFQEFLSENGLPISMMSVQYVWLRREPRAL